MNITEVCHTYRMIETLFFSLPCQSVMLFGIWNFIACFHCLNGDLKISSCFTKLTSQTQSYKRRRKIDGTCPVIITPFNKRYVIFKNIIILRKTHFRANKQTWNESPQNDVIVFQLIAIRLYLGSQLEPCSRSQHWKQTLYS